MYLLFCGVAYSLLWDCTPTLNHCIDGGSGRNQSHTFTPSCNRTPSIIQVHKYHMHISYIYKYICPNVYILYIYLKWKTNMYIRTFTKATDCFLCFPVGSLSTLVLVSPSRRHLLAEWDVSVKPQQKGATKQHGDISIFQWIYIIYIYIIKINKNPTKNKIHSLESFFNTSSCKIIREFTHITTPKHPPNPNYSPGDQ